jgi:3-isopropylmalate dehydrogenase
MGKVANTKTGSAPDISGKGLCNPVGMILSVAMLLKYSLNLIPESKIVEDAVRNVIESGISTKDIGGSASTSETGSAVAAEVEKLLQKK